MWTGNLRALVRARRPAQPREILAAARVLYAHRLLKDPGFTIEDVAKRSDTPGEDAATARAQIPRLPPAKCVCR